MTFGVQLHLFYTKNLHDIIIEDCHIFLGFRLIPVNGPLDEVHTDALRRETDFAPVNTSYFTRFPPLFLFRF